MFLLVGSGCAAEHQGVATMALHGRRQNPAAVHIHVPVQEWVGHRLAHSFQAGEMNHAIHGSGHLEGVIHSFGVAHIPLNQRQLG